MQFRSACRRVSWLRWSRLIPPDANSHRRQHLPRLPLTEFQPNHGGPSTWHDLAETAATRAAGQTAAGYLYTSIVHPNAYVVNGYANPTGHAPGL